MLKKMLLFLGLVLLLASAAGFTWLALNAPQKDKTTTALSARQLAAPTIFAIVISPTATPTAFSAAAQPTLIPLPPIAAPPTAALQPAATRAAASSQPTRAALATLTLEPKGGGGPALPPGPPAASATPPASATPRQASGGAAPAQPTRAVEIPSLSEKSGGGGVVIATPAPTPIPPRPRVINAEWPGTLQKGSTGNVRISLVQTDEKTFTPVVSTPNNATFVGTPITLGTPGADLSAQFGANYDAYVSANLAGAAFNIDALMTEPQSLEQPDITWTWSVLAKEERAQTLDAVVNIEWRPRSGGAPIQRTLWRSQFTIEVNQSFIPMDLFGILNALSAFAGSVLSGPWVIEKVLEVRRSRKKAHTEQAKA